MKVSISSWGYRMWFTEARCDMMGFIDEVKRQGADGFEIFPAHIDQEDPASDLRRIARRAADEGLEISSLIAGNDFALPVTAQRAEHVERMKRWILYAADAGICRMNVFTGYHQPGQDPIMEACRVIDAFREVTPSAEERQVTLCVENHSSVCRDADGLLAIVRAVGSPMLRTNPDPSNFCGNFTGRTEKEREIIYSETEKIAPLMANAHLKIADFTPDGDHKHVDVGRILDIFRGAGYEGHVVLEYYGTDDPVGANARGVALLRKLLG